MKKFVLIPDSFKGTLSSSRVCDIFEACIRGKYPEADIIKIPVADGGEGSVDAFLEAVGGEKCFAECADPLFDRMQGFYGLIDGGNCAVLEMAASAGLPLLSEKKVPLAATTYGVGELMSAALSRGAKKMVVGLGGSATTDGGCGCAAALGVKFFDRDGKAFIPVGGTLRDIVDIDISGLRAEIRETDLVTMCDIDNPLYGEEGAAYIFSPQKGADPEQVKFLDRGLRNLAEAAERCLGFAEWDFPGAGAAGGMGFGMKVFFGSRIQMGIETVLDTVRFDEVVKGADYVFTGEGRLDSQSLRGKVVIGVSHRAAKHGVPVIAVVGCTGPGFEGALNEGVSKVIVTNHLNLPFSQAKLRAEADMEYVVRELVAGL